MRDELRGSPLGLAIQAVAHLPLHGDDAALLHLVADDHADFFRFRCHAFPRVRLKPDTTSACSSPAGAGLDVCFSRLSLFLADHRLDASEVAAREAQLHRRIQLSEGLLEPHAKQLILELARPCFQILDLEIAQFGDVDHDTFSWENLVANLVRIGSFDAANWSASRASDSVTPSISNRIRPGRTTATHCSGAPFPLPMRVS